MFYWFQRVKDKEFESNSQPQADSLQQKIYWFQRVKDKEFESNSQLSKQVRGYSGDWFQRVKDKEFESNSQLNDESSMRVITGFSVSKIKNLKAIHNY